MNSGQASWFNFACTIFEEAAAFGYKVPTIEPILASDFPRPARRPRNTILSVDKIIKDFGVVPREHTLAVREIIADLVPQMILMEERES